MARRGTDGENEGLALREPAVVRAKRRPSYIERIDAAVHRSTMEERQAVLDFRERLFGTRDEDRVAWLYDAAPGVTDVNRPLWTWSALGRIEAHQGAIRTQLRIGPSERRLSWAIDLHVSEDYRALGVGAVLPLRVVDEADVVAGLDISGHAQRSFARAGWTHLGTIPTWVRPLSAAAVLSTRLPEHSPVRYSAPVLNAGLRWLQAVERLRARAYQLAWSEQFDERADVVWNHCADAWPIIAKRDREWLRWRWDENPEFRVRIAWLERGGRTIGWAVLSNREHHNLRGGHVVDMLCRPEDLRALVTLVVDSFYRDRLDAAYCVFRAAGASLRFRACGFIKRETNVALMVNTTKLVATERPTVMDPERWYVTGGDSDLDRARTGVAELV